MITPQRVGLALALPYVAAAGLVLYVERGHQGGFVPNMGTFLMTAPLSMPLSYLGMEPNLRSVWVALGLVAGTALVVYQVAFWLTRMFKGR
jgi:ABC-type spermidine/putrescine transport system permease subunit I